MNKRVGTIIVVSFMALAMPGCAIRSAFGPCYGYGCPSGAGSTPQNAMNAGGGPAAASNAASAKAQDEKPHGFVEFFKSLLPSHHTGVAPATTAPAPGATASGK
jgi:hypothetical protein